MATRSERRTLAPKTCLLCFRVVESHTGLSSAHDGPVRCCGIEGEARSRENVWGNCRGMDAYQSAARYFKDETDNTRVGERQTACWSAPAAALRCLCTRSVRGEGAHFKRGGREAFAECYPPALKAALAGNMRALTCMQQ